MSFGFLLLSLILLLALAKVDFPRLTTSCITLLLSYYHSRCSVYLEFLCSHLQFFHCGIQVRCVCYLICDSICSCINPVPTLGARRLIQNNMKSFLILLIRNIYSSFTCSLIQESTILNIHWMIQTQKIFVPWP